MFCQTHTHTLTHTQKKNDFSFVPRQRLSSAYVYKTYLFQANIPFPIFPLSVQKSRGFLVFSGGIKNNADPEVG